MKKEQNGCCFSVVNRCCSPKQERKHIVIDFLYLDLTVCTRCQGTENVLEEAIGDVSQVLEAAGIDVIVNKINITSREQAVLYKFVSSPTIRINGRDIDVDLKETLCESCGDLCNENVDCRVWLYEGVEYTEPPKPLIVNAILKEVYGDSKSVEEKEYILPQNLEVFFGAIEKNKR